MTTYWFKLKQYGYGSTPTTRQGWAVTIATAIVVVGASLLLPAVSGRGQLSWTVLVVDALAVAALVIVSRRKTDGEWRWRWGSR
jgi:hypothetical protein